MTYLLLTSLLTNLALAGLFLQDRGRDRDFWAALLAKEVKERAQLLNRVQAPEIAVAQAIEIPEPSRQFVEFDNDEDFHEEMQRINGNA